MNLFVFVIILDFFYRIVKNVLDNEVQRSCSDQLQSPAIGKTFVACVMPYVTAEVNFTCH